MEISQNKWVFTGDYTFAEIPDHIDQLNQTSISQPITLDFSKLKNIDEIEVWGDGNQKRSFLYIDDCIDASLNLFNSSLRGPLNIGSEEMVTINEMIKILENIANKKFKKKYLLDKPKGVKGRNSDNTLIKKELNWEPKYSLNEGLKKTYNWIENQIKNK